MASITERKGSKTSHSKKKNNGDQNGENMKLTENITERKAK